MGGHITSDDFFKSIELADKMRDIAALEKLKDDCMQSSLQEARAQAVLALGKESSNLLMKDLGSLLDWYGIPKKDQGKNKAEKLALYTKILEEGRRPLPVKAWSVDNERQLVDARSLEIDMADTALGRHQATLKREYDAVVDKMEGNEREALRRKLDLLDEEEKAAAAAALQVLAEGEVAVDIQAV